MSSLAQFENTWLTIEGASSPLESTEPTANVPIAESTAIQAYYLVAFGSLRKRSTKRRKTRARTIS